MQGLSGTDLAALIAAGWMVEVEVFRWSADVLREGADLIRRVDPASEAADDLVELSQILALAAVAPTGDAAGERHLRLVT